MFCVLLIAMFLFTGYTINKVLCSLEALDKQNFDKSVLIDTLYHKIFDQTQSKATDSQVSFALLNLSLS